MAARSIGNGLLDGLSAEDFEQLQPHLEQVLLAQGQVLNSQGEAIEHVWFLRTGIISMIVRLEGGAAVEVGIIGPEGMIGVPVLLGSNIASTEARVQVAGTAL